MNEHPRTAGATAAVLDPIAAAPDMTADFRLLFHRLNNQLGIALAHAELLESKAADERDRLRATQVVTSVLQAMGTAREIRHRTETVAAAADIG